MKNVGEAAVQTRGLSKRFNGRAVISELDLHVPTGAIYGFLGQNGAGKTTTIRMLLGLMHADGGDVTLLGEPVLRAGRESSAARLAAAAKIGALVEGPAFYPFLSGRRNLRLFGRLLGITDKARIDAALARVKLDARGDDLFRVYSRGMKQRLGIAAALLHEPRLVMLDEPMNGLDPPGVILVRTLLQELAAGGATVLLSSHLLHDAEQLCTDVGILHEGHLVAQGSIAELVRTEHVTVDLELDRPEDGRTALAALSGLDRLELEGTGEDARLVVELERTRLGELTRRLVEAGLELRTVVPRKRTLENLFLDETRDPASDPAAAGAGKEGAA